MNVERPPLPVGRRFFQQSAILDPDAIAVELQAESNTELGNLEAGKEVIRSADAVLAGAVSDEIVALVQRFHVLLEEMKHRRIRQTEWNGRVS